MGFVLTQTDGQIAVEKHEQHLCCLLFCVTVNKHMQTLTWILHAEYCILNPALCKFGIGTLENHGICHFNDMHSIKDKDQFTQE